MNIVFLADENFPKSSIDYLRKNKLTIRSIKEERPGVDDETILKIAHDEKLVVLTFDRDYSKLIYKDKIYLPQGLIFFRVPLKVGEADLPAQLLLNFIAKEEIDLEDKFIVIQSDKIRVKPLSNK
jgi:hypothetical protein